MNSVRRKGFCFLSSGQTLSHTGLFVWRVCACMSTCSDMYNSREVTETLLFLERNRPICAVCRSLAPSSDEKGQLHLPLRLEMQQSRFVFQTMEHKCQWFMVSSFPPHLCSLLLFPGGGGERWHGEGEAGQQEDSVQPAAGSCGSALPHVESQEHGENLKSCPGSPSDRNRQPWGELIPSKVDTKHFHSFLTHSHTHTQPHSQEVRLGCVDV